MEQHEIEAQALSIYRKDYPERVTPNLSRIDEDKLPFYLAMAERKLRKREEKVKRSIDKVVGAFVEPVQRIKPGLNFDLCEALNDSPPFMEHIGPNKYKLIGDGLRLRRNVNNTWTVTMMATHEGKRIELYHWVLSVIQSADVVELNGVVMEATLTLETNM
jgi:hypothetical protein